MAQVQRVAGGKGFCCSQGYRGELEFAEDPIENHAFPGNVPARMHGIDLDKFLQRNETILYKRIIFQQEADLKELPTFYRVPG